MNEYLELSQWALLFGAIMPILVGIVTKKVARPAVKATTLLVLNAVNGVLVDFFATPDGFDFKGAIVNALAGLVTSVGTYYGFLKQTGNLGLNNATADFGYGGGNQAPARSRYPDVA